MFLIWQIRFSNVLKNTFFSEQVTDNILAESDVVAELSNYAFFAIESLPVNLNPTSAASSQEALLLLGSSNDVTVNTAQLYLVNKDIDTAELDAVKNYLLNPVDSRFKDNYNRNCATSIFRIRQNDSKS